MIRKSALFATFTWLLFSAAAAGASERDLVVGVPPGAGAIELFEPSPRAGLLRWFTADPLVTVTESDAPRLVGAAELRVLPERGEMRFRLRDDWTFHSGERVIAEDAAGSLKLCLARGIIRAPIEIAIEYLDAPGGRREGWVRVFSSALRGAPPSEYDATLRELKGCPVLEQHSFEFFGKLAGTGVNYLSSGIYQATSFKSDGEVKLRRVRNDKRQVNLPITVLFKPFRSEEEALSTLRAGQFDLVFAKDFQVLERAEKDETLTVLNCSNYSIILRRGLRFWCPELRVDDGWGFEQN